MTLYVPEGLNGMPARAHLQWSDHHALLGYYDDSCDGPTAEGLDTQPDVPGAWQLVGRAPRGSGEIVGVLHGLGVSWGCALEWSLWEAIGILHWSDRQGPLGDIDGSCSGPTPEGRTPSQTYRKLGHLRWSLWKAIGFVRHSTG